VSTTSSVILGISCSYKRGLGRPRTNWRGVIKKDLEKMGLTWEEAQSAALKRQEWHWSVAQCVHLDVG